MESGKEPEQISSNPEVTETGEIDKLPEQLGFLETTELKLLRDAAIEAHLVGEPEQANEIRGHYQVLGEEVVNELYGEEYTRAQIGLLISLGNLRRDTGKVAVYVDDLEDAIMYLTGMGYTEIIHVLEKARDQSQKQLES